MGFFIFLTAFSILVGIYLLGAHFFKSWPYNGSLRKNRIKNLPEAKGLSKAEKAELEKVYFQKLIDLYVEYRWFTNLKRKSYGDDSKTWTTNVPDKFKIIKSDYDAEDLVTTATYVAGVYHNRSGKNIVDFYLEEKKRAETRDTSEARFADRVESVLDSSIDTLKGQIGAKYGFDSPQFELGLTYNSVEDLIRLRDRSTDNLGARITSQEVHKAKRATNNGI